MRTLKKTLCFVLAVVMVLGLGVFSVAAADSTVDKKYAEAVDVTSAVGIFQGGSGVDWTTELTRGQAATILCRLQGVDESTLPAGSTFTDVKGTWADKYVNYAQGLGLVNGYGDGTYGVNDPLTGYQWSLMLLHVLGYKNDAEGITGVNWEVVTAKLARQAGLDSGVTNGSTGINRQQAAQFTFNALKADLVEYEGGSTITTPDGTTVVSGAERRKITATSDVSQAFGDDKVDGKYIVQLGEDLYNGSLKKADGEPDDFGRPTAGAWEYNKKTVSSQLKPAAFTYDKKITTDALEKDLKGYSIGEDAVNYTLSNDTESTLTTYDGTTDGKELGDLYEEIDKQSGNGYQVEIYANSDKEITDVVIARYGVATIDKVTTDKSGDSTYTLNNRKSGKTYANPEDGDDTIVLNGSFAKGDVVTYVVANKVLYLYPTTKVTGSQSAKSSAKPPVITVSGAKYTLAAYADSTAFTNSPSDADYYLDQFGYAAFVNGIETEAQYAIVLGIVTASNGLDGGETYSTRLLFTDGTTKDVTMGVNTTDGSGFEKKNLEGVTSDVEESDGFRGKIVSYTVDSKGVYTLTMKTTTKNSGEVADGTTVTTKGLAKFFYNGTDDSATADSKTVYLVATDKGYAAYTGYANVPTLKFKAKTETDGDGAPVTAPVAYYAEDSNALVVYIDMRQSTEAETSSDDLLYFSSDTVTTTGTGSSETKTMTAYVNGESKEVTSSKTGVFDADTDRDKLMKITYDADGERIAALEEVTYVTIGSAAKNGVIEIDGESYTFDGNETVYVIDTSEHSLSDGTVAEAAAGDKAYIITKGSSGADELAIKTLYIIKVKPGE